jgi:hypothetical protein
MKLVKMAWVLGAMTSLSLGMGAEACSSSSTPSTSGVAASCTTLEACCPYLGAQSTSCTTAVSMNSESGCQMYLAAAQETCTANMKTGSGITPGSGTSTPPGSGITPPGSGSSISPGSGTSPGSSGSGSSAADCYTAPKLYPETTAGVYCPYDYTDAGTVTCAAQQHCCETASKDAGASACVANGTACPSASDTDWQCLGPLDCAGNANGTVCCGTGTPKVQAACTNDAGPQPPYYYLSSASFTGTTCASSCSTYQVCSQNSDCTGATAGTTCTPVDSHHSDFGICGPAM